MSILSETVSEFFTNVKTNVFSSSDQKVEGAASGSTWLDGITSLLTTSATQTTAGQNIIAAGTEEAKKSVVYSTVTSPLFLVGAAVVLYLAFFRGRK